MRGDLDLKDFIDQKKSMNIIYFSYCISLNPRMLIKILKNAGKSPNIIKAKALPPHELSG